MSNNLKQLLKDIVEGNQKRTFTLQEIKSLMLNKGLDRPLQILKNMRAQGLVHFEEGNGQVLVVCC